ncbi:MAG: DUF2959 domain-containing protein [Kiritimatiellae bacterium]|nr:DUF2959 domain-containing protein [Kiritimatiellia bacterium]
MKKTSLACLLLLALGLCACSSLWDATREHVFGTAKRSILVDRVADAKDAQEDTQQVFQNALDEFASVITYEGGDLEAEYRKMQAAYDRCAAKAQTLDSRIDDVERVSKSLFKEWARENDQYENPEYRRNSEAQLKATRQNCDEMIAAMRRAEAKVAPVLRVLHDQVLFLKHNLNAAALSSLQGEQARVEADVAALVAEMNKAIAESQAFIDKMAK